MPQEKTRKSTREEPFDVAAEAELLADWMTQNYSLYATGNLDDGTHTELHCNCFGGFKVIIRGE